MSDDEMTREHNFDFTRVPKVDLHRHLEGSLRLETLLELSRSYGITLPVRPSLQAMVQMQTEDAFNYSTFLSKFQTLRLFFLSPQVIQRIVHEAVIDAALDGVMYLELRFTPVALSRARSFKLEEVMDWACDSAAQASGDMGITTRLIVSVNRHEPVELAEEVVQMAEKKMHKGIVGLDLAGNEADFSGEPFLPVFRRARAAGLSLCVHAGEWGGPENVRQAIEVFGADRIGHGVTVMRDPAVVELARERNIPFEVCVTSNHQSGVVSRLEDHPLPDMLEAGLNVTIATDDPSISQITLSDEYELIHSRLGMSYSDLSRRIHAAAHASFLPPDEKAALVAYLSRALNDVLPTEPGPHTGGYSQ